jgi:hypothetical protein
MPLIKPTLSYLHRFRSETIKELFREKASLERGGLTIRQKLNELIELYVSGGLQNDIKAVELYDIIHGMEPEKAVELLKQRINK